ncbi:MAG: hypothetical protein NTW17_03310, partial [Candidatus Pacearchaeota archaeon]|nr:hypothetical protein [Candidatus Pacearchaeota archaeon]
TNPVPSASCSPATVDSGATFPCECSVSDATSGVSSSSSSSTSGSITSTSATGTFTYTCSVVDNAGNSASSDATYSVTQTPGSPSGSGSGGGAITWVTQTVATEIFEQGYTAQLGSKNRIKVQVASEDHYIGVVSVSATEAVIQISSDPVQVTLSAGEDAKVDVDDDSFYDVYVLLNSIINNKANVTVQKIHEAVPEGESGVATTGELEGETTPAEEGASLLWLWILIGVVVVVAIGWGIGKKKK